MLKTVTKTERRGARRFTAEKFYRWLAPCRSGSVSPSSKSRRCPPVYTSYFLLLLSLFFPLGCNRDYVAPGRLVEVQGEVYLDNQPVADARILFVPEDTAPGNRFALSYGTTNAKGEFELKLADGSVGALAGRHRVFISKADFSNSEPRPILIKLSGIRVADVETEDLLHKQHELFIGDGDEIPSYYNSQSELTCEVVPGRGIQRPKFNLESIDPLLRQD